MFLAPINLDRVVVTIITQCDPRLGVPGVAVQRASAHCVVEVAAQQGGPSEAGLLALPARKAHSHRGDLVSQENGQVGSKNWELHGLFCFLPSSLNLLGTFTGILTLSA